MITNLHIKNIGIISDISFNLNQGLNVLTGETGAGKSLIMNSFNLLLGGRFSKDIIRKGEDYCFVEAGIYLPNFKGIVEENIVVSREIYLNGRNICKINGRLVTVSELKNFMSNVIDIHGQHDNQLILNPETHIGYLDCYIGEKILHKKEKFLKLYEEYVALKKELKKNYGDDIEKQRKLDLLNYQKNEIEAARLVIGEDDELEQERDLISNSEKISANLEEADNQINEVAIDSISVAIRALGKIEGYSKDYEECLNTLRGVYYDIQEVSRTIVDLKEDISFDAEKKAEIESRLDLIFSLKRKYGNSIEEILSYNEKISKEISTIENLEEYIKELRIKINAIENEMFDISKSMNKIRMEESIGLEEKINKELKDLEMKNAKIRIKIDFNDNREFNENGLDNVEIFITTNIGTDEKPLIKIASGGEMSRIMLAIKRVLADTDEVPIMVFDEIDTGISGLAANSVSEKLKAISKKHQVLCVTHLANIAANADYNYYISKEVKDNKTETSIRMLNAEETIKEIARISSGNITEIALKHARELKNMMLTTC